MCAFENYKLDEEDDEPFNFPIMACAGSTDSRCTDDHLLQWKQHTTAPFHGPKRFPGGHVYLTSHPDPLLQEVQDLLLSLLYH